MEQSEELVALLRLSPEQMARLPRRILIAGVLGIFCCWAFLFAFLALIILRAWSNLSLDGPPSVNDSLLLWALSSGLALWGLLSVAGLIPSCPTRAKATQLREAVLRGDETVAPPVLDQPAALDGEELLLIPQSIRHLRRASGHALATLTLIVVLVCVVFGVALLIFFFGVNGLLASILADSSNFSLVGLLPFIQPFFLVERVLFEPLILEGFAVLRGLSFQSVSVDDWSIRWRKPGSRQREGMMPWHDVCAFVVVRETAKSNKIGKAASKSTYMLLAQDTTFAWEVWPRARAAVHAANDQLIRIIVARTKLPLRDLTAATQKAKESATAEEIRDTMESLRSLDTLSAAEKRKAMRAMVTRKDFALPKEYIDQVVPRGGIRGRTYWINALLIVVLMGIALGGIRQFQQEVAQYRNNYYAGLPARIYSSHPLSDDPLTVDDNQWPVGGPTKSDSERWFFADGSYHITGGPAGDIMWAWPDLPASNATGDVAVAVTAMQHGSSENDGVGLLLRGSDYPRDSEVVFYVSPTQGNWSLFQYTDTSDNPDDNWTFLAGDDSSAIHTGPEATNRLLVVIHGSKYLCYINGLLVGTEGDEGLPQTGHMGVYLNDNSTEGIFNDFTIYAVPEPPASPLPFGVSVPV